MIVYDDVKSLHEYLDILSRHLDNVILVGGNGCGECLIALYMLRECVSEENIVYIKLAYNIDDSLLEFLFENNLYGIPILVYRHKHIPISGKAYEVCRILQNL